MNSKQICIGLRCYDADRYDIDESNNKIHIKATGEIYEKEALEECSNFAINPLIIPRKKRVIGIGDIHGDMELAINFLKVAKVIQEVDVQKILGDKFNFMIEEYLTTLTIKKNSTLEFENEINEKKSYDDISNHIKNQVEVVYRYYKIDGKFYVKIIQEDNNPNHINKPNSYVCRNSNYDRFCDNSRWFRWIGEDTHIVQVGDQIDRCRPWSAHGCKKQETTVNDEDSDLEIMLFYDSLDRIAQEKGGRLFSLLGNHEIMNVKGDMRYVSYKGIVNFSDNMNNKKNRNDFNRGTNIRKSKFREIISKKLSCTRSTILIIGDYLFVHGGIAINLAKEHNIIEVNSLIRKFLYGSLIYSHELQKLLESSRYSPLWYRKLAYIQEDVNNIQNQQCKTLYEPTLNAFNKINSPIYSTISTEPTFSIKGMIIGHTPQFTVFGKGITTACADRIIRVDIGASQAFDNIAKKDKSREPQVVEIITNLKTGESSIKILHL